MTSLDPRLPEGQLNEKWSRRLEALELVSPGVRREKTVIVIGTGLAGAAAAASLSEQGYRVRALTLHDSPRRAHSVAAQGGINAAKDYRSEGDSVGRLFFDTLKGGDYRSREANVHRLAELSGKIVDQAVAQGVPFAREYGGQLANRSFGGALVSRTFYARGQTGQQLLLGAYQALLREESTGRLSLLARRELLDVVVAGGRARGVVARNLSTGALETHLGDAVVVATGGYANLYFLSSNAKSSNATAIWRAFRRGAGFANPGFVQFHPTCLPLGHAHASKLVLMSESLRNDGRVWVPRAAGDHRPAAEIPEAERDYFLERLHPRYGNLVPRDIASRATKQVCDEGRGVLPGGRAVYLDLADAIAREGEAVLCERYGNLFEMYRKLTREDPLRVPMRIYPAAHYTMGGLWVDYDLMSTLPGLFVLGEANFSDHGANRLGASALMQALADGYFVAPRTIGDYIARQREPAPSESSPEVAAAVTDVERRLSRLAQSPGRTPAIVFHRELGRTLWDACGLERNAGDLKRAVERIAELRERFWRELSLPGSATDLNQELEYAGRVADFLELGELVCLDAIAREESCGCHFRSEHTRRDDRRFAHVAVWLGSERGAELVREPLRFESGQPTERSYS